MNECNEEDGIGLFEKFYNVPTDEECQFYCQITSGGNFFVFKRKNNNCYIYTHKDEQTMLQGCKRIEGPVKPEIESCNSANNLCSVRKISL